MMNDIINIQYLNRVIYIILILIIIISLFISFIENYIIIHNYIYKIPINVILSSDYNSYIDDIITIRIFEKSAKHAKNINSTLYADIKKNIKNCLNNISESFKSSSPISNIFKSLRSSNILNPNNEYKIIMLYNDTLEEIKLNAYIYEDNIYII